MMREKGGAGGFVVFGSPARLRRRERRVAVESGGGGSCRLQGTQQKAPRRGRKGRATEVRREGEVGGGGANWWFVGGGCGGFRRDKK
ncbi:hypothetical protein BVRB_013980 [Beta vulgaris subsp. vulgaris]|uniref:Uncharacterized protein n=1 Tax=Beta vulgaris subsp. vulgaris TaxID=3555 RepID=A0A0J8B520_BETVV|nr:hypothetical protein BVRB_013980 [Beta vulgaris subsp. vulgaris]